MPIPTEITTLVFDWGDTLMALDPRFSGPMVDWPEVQAVLGAVEALARLGSRFRLVVASNAVDSSVGQVRAALARVGLDTFISEIFTFAELGARKPDPAFFRQAALALSAAPHQLVMIGDLYAIDIPGARRAGWHAAWYNPGLKPAPGPVPLHDLEFAHMVDLPYALEELDQPDALTIQTWYLLQGGGGTLWQHVGAVGLASYNLATMIRSHGQPVNPLLAYRGGLLHDIAKISSQDSSLNHGEFGASILAELGYPVLAEIARRHLIYYLLNPETHPRTWEEKIVHFADKICEGSQLVEWEHRLEGLTQRYPGESDRLQACTPAVKALQVELAQAAGILPTELVDSLRRANFQ